MTAFTHALYSDSNLSHPVDEFEARNYMLGRTKAGDLVDPCNWIPGEVRGGVDCHLVNPLYWYSGDPVTDYGWINTWPYDQVMTFHSGPFTLEEDKPITIIVGYTIGQGDSPLNSVTVGKELSAFVQQFYQSNFDDTILPVEDEKNLIVDEFKLFQNYPNPFNPTTTIRFTISDVRFTTLKLYDVLGNEIKALVNEEKSTGNYEVKFDASSLPSGIYFYQLRAGSFVETKKMILLK